MSFCHVFRVSAAPLIAMVADKLGLASTGDRLLFASTMTEFILQRFKGEEVLCLCSDVRCISLLLPVFLCPQALCCAC